MRRTDDKKDGGDRLAGLSPAVSGPPGPTVIPFRRAPPPLRSAAEVSPPETSAPFIPLGKAVSAVIMRVGNSRLRAFGPVSVGAGGKDRADDDGSLGG